MFRVHVLGMGNFFTERYNHPSFLLELGKSFLLLDAPANLPKMLRCYQKTLWCRRQPVEGIDRLVMGNLHRYAITHDHIDHAGGVETVAFWKFYKEWRHSKRLGGKPRPKLVTTPEVLSDLEKQLMHKLRTSECYPGKELKLTDYFEVKTPELNETYDEGLFTITPTPANHAISACGFYVEHMGKSLWYSGDTRLDRHVFAENSDADMIIYDCSNIRAGGHATAEELMKLPEDIREKMRVYHVPDDMIERRRRPDGKDGAKGSQAAADDSKDLIVAGTDLKVLKQYEFYDIE
ncbi:TPA: ribonuclease Z [Candidatus Woesearchaeota archaeon]|nr:ribonuclease Z [Candidatus Woesearchaeota archaeon]